MRIKITSPVQHGVVGADGRTVKTLYLTEGDTLDVPDSQAVPLIESGAAKTIPQ